MSLGGLLSMMLKSMVIIAGHLYDAAEEYRAGNTQVRAEDIDEVQIHWYCGSVSLIPTRSEILRITESGETLTESERLHWRLKDRTLYIEFWESGYKAQIQDAYKNLTVEVPDGIRLTVNVTSAQIRIPEALRAEEVYLSSRSGDIRTGRIDSETRIQMENHSGSIECREMTAAGIGLHDGSGSIRTGYLETQKEMEVRTGSGSISIYNFASDGSVSLESGSGSVKTGKGRVTDSLSIRNTSGAICADFLYAQSMKLEQTSGSLSIDSLETSGSLECTSASGGTRLAHIKAGHGNIRSTSGTVKVGINQCDYLGIASTSGSVQVKILNENGVSIRCGTVSGSVNVHGFVQNGQNRYIRGDGRDTLEISTASGSIGIE